MKFEIVSNHLRSIHRTNTLGIDWDSVVEELNNDKTVYLPVKNRNSIRSAVMKRRSVKKINIRKYKNGFIFWKEPDA